MSRSRDVRLEKYEISRYAYRELMYFCRQYPEKKARLREIRGMSAGAVLRAGGKSRRGGGSQTEKKAIRAARLSSDCEMIEKAAAAAGGEVAAWLLKNVTEGASWDVLCPPIGRRQFYERRRAFFYALARMRGMA